MNSLFGGGPAGAGRPAGAPNKPKPTSNLAAPVNDSSASGATTGLGGWGGMFKSALNQMESHLDRYLELPNEGQPADPRQQQQQRQRQPGQPPRASSRQRTGAALSGRAAESKTTAARAVAADVSGLRSSASSGSLLRRTSAGRAQTPLRDSVDVGEHSMSSDLLDAFGVELDDTRPASAADTIQRVRSDDAIERVSSPASLNTTAAASSSARNEFEAPVDRDSEPGGSLADCASVVSAATPEPADAKADNPYIQAELKKLRETPIPTTPDDMRTLIEEYRNRIEALLIEGQSWSAKELRLSNTIKKLRADNKGFEKTAHMVQKKLELTLGRNDELSEKLKRASLSDRSSADSIKAMKSKAQEADSQRRQLEHDLRVAAETRNSLKTALTSAEGELSARCSELAAIRAQQAQAIADAQRDARADADRRIAEADRVSADEKQRLQAQIDELQQRLLVVEEGARDREVSSLTQIRTLRAQLRSADAQSRDIGGEIQQHTLPLLQQIEELQARQTEQRHEWARKEDEWAARVRSSAKELESVRERLQRQVAETDKVKKEAAAEGKRVDSGHEEAARLKDQLQAEIKIRAEVKQQLEEARATIRQLNTKLDNTLALRNAAVELVSTGSSPSPALPGDKSKFNHVRNPSISSISSTDSRSRRGSSADAPLAALSDTSTTASAAYGATKKLSSQITSLKAQLQTALRQKDEYSRNLVDLSLEIEKLRSDAAKHGDLDKELETLKHRHETALEMLGEKTEELMDLQADMEDMRKVYKQQLQSLVPDK
ncbi:hypothetical protein GGF43_003036 [Coemansia sp. RSA 2618]|nr:hypothetical protein GGF43_003036 [Coemansia sp. RSA 2618]